MCRVSYIYAPHTPMYSRAFKRCTAHTSLLTIMRVDYSGESTRHGERNTMRFDFDIVYAVAMTCR